MAFEAKPGLWLTVSVLVVWGLIVATQGPAAPTPEAQRGADLQLYRAITSRVAQGEGYYRVLAHELPSRGYPTRSVFNWRLPTLTWLNAAAPSPIWGRAALAALVALFVGTWTMAVRRSIPRMTVACMAIVSMSAVPMALTEVPVVLHEAWAGVIIAASLACWGVGRWQLAVALGVAALTIRELALPYVVTMAGVAWWEGRRREAFAWMAGAGVFVLVWIWHVSRVLEVMPRDGLTSTWLRLEGWGFVLDASKASPLLTLLPHPLDQWVLAMLVPVLWAGFWYWKDGLGRRLALIVGGYFAMFAIVGRPDNWYWGFLIGLLIPFGGLGYFFEPRPVGQESRSSQSTTPRAEG